MPAFDSRLASQFHLVNAYSMYAITLAGGCHAFTRGEPTFSSAHVLDAIQGQAITVSNHSINQSVSQSSYAHVLDAIESQTITVSTN